MLFQQGDVLIEWVGRIEYFLPERCNNVLYYGETSGHAHRLTGHVRIYEKTDEEAKENFLYVVAPEGTEVLHEEHKPIKLPPGNYRVRKVREYDHFKNIIRPVVD